MSTFKILIVIVILTVIAISVLRSERTAYVIDFFINQNRFLLQKTAKLCSSASRAKDEYRYCLGVARRKPSTFMQNWELTCVRLHQAAVEKQAECDKSEIELDYVYRINPPKKTTPPPRDLLEERLP